MKIPGLFSSALVFAGCVHAGQAVVNATDVIYAAGSQANEAAAAGPVPGCNACNAPATVPGGIALTSSANYVTFSSVMGSLTSSDGNVCASPEGCVVMNNNGGNAVNDPDGNGAGAPGISASSGEGSISGVVAPGWGYLVGVFVAAGGPSGVDPPALNFTAGAVNGFTLVTGGTAFTSLSPVLDQAFFIGDGLTGDGTGTMQRFYVPAGATELYLGISDVCAFDAPPSCYGDNLGTFTASYTVTNVSANGPTISAVKNALSFSSTLCPGLLATVYGTNFGTNSANAVVMVGGQSAYVYSPGYSATQMDIEIPFGLSTGPTAITVSVGGVSSSAVPITLSATSPAFTSLSGAGTGLATIYPNGSANNFTPGSPAQPGSTAVAYVAGLGATTPPVATGVVAGGTEYAITPLPSITVDGVAATVLAALAYPGTAGLYQVNFTLPSTGIQGTVPIVMTIGGQSSSSMVTIPIAGLSSVVANGSFANPGTIAPGTIASVFANGLGSASTNQLSGIFPSTSSEGVQVTFKGEAAPIFHLIPSVPATSSQQIDLFVPSDLPTSGTVNVQLTTSSTDYPNYTLNMVPASPSMFRFTDPTTGSAYAVVQFVNSAWVVLPAAATADIGFPACGASTNAATECGQPANIGDTLVIYLTGLGLATPNGSPTGTPLPTGQNPPLSGSPLYETPTMPVVTIGGVPATVLFSGLTPGYAGEYQIDVTVPSGVASGDTVPVKVTMLGMSDTANISIQPSRVTPPL